ncbi:MAG: hypothetical protein ACI3X9_01205 [Bacteroidaceae bacterium]
MVREQNGWGYSYVFKALVNQVFTGAFSFVGCQRVAKKWKIPHLSPLQVAKGYNKRLTETAENLVDRGNVAEIFPSALLAQAEEWK